MLYCIYIKSQERSPAGHQRQKDQKFMTTCDHMEKQNNSDLKNLQSNKGWQCTCIVCMRPRFSPLHSTKRTWAMWLQRPMWEFCRGGGEKQQEDQNVKVVLGCSTGARPA